MFDIQLRPLKDRIFDPICKTIPQSITPLQITFLAFISGVISCIAAASGSPMYATIFWILNRSLDCLDGAVARQRNQSSDLGGFLDLLSDFIIYSAIPICCTLGSASALSTSNLQKQWLAVAIVESTFHINNFILFFVAALTEKTKNVKESRVTKELTSVSMRPALVEGAESGAFFTLMLAMPGYTEVLCWLLSCGVAIGIVQRVVWVVGALESSSGKAE